MLFDPHIFTSITVTNRHNIDIRITNNVDSNECLQFLDDSHFPCQDKTSIRAPATDRRDSAAGQKRLRDSLGTNCLKKCMVAIHEGDHAPVRGNGGKAANRFTYNDARCDLNDGELPATSYNHE